MKTILKTLGTLLVIFTCILTVQAQDSKPAQPQSGDLDFASKAMASNNFELQTASIALSKSQNPNIKQYAQMITDDHTAAGNELSTIVKNKNWQLSTSDDQNYKSMIDQLNNADTASFDRIYTDLMVKSHQDAISLFKDASTGTAITDADFKKFATDKIPVFEKHLDQIKNMQPSDPSVSDMHIKPNAPSPAVKKKVLKPTLK
ncbi:hypothetical protein GCM10009120_45190 [Sphingobacterium siyangense subsp. cladoniae]|uniref:DUF4142 domain-containing protein n=1 Tax=Sphingobacterium siyangense TaxID=459529 RepID=UPI0031F893FB